MAFNILSVIICFRNYNTFDMAFNLSEQVSAYYKSFECTRFV